MKYLVIGLCAIALAGCASKEPVLITTEYKALDIPAKYYNCPVSDIKNVDVAKLTDAQVAVLIKKLELSNQTCKKSSLAIQAYVAAAKRNLSKK